ncbi:hypothetical protein FJZ31_26215 [Candidatus Poribacteria bacterium]|nr:hypothetical protein [Candidatus Poribacteria bacterium]
MRMGGATWIPQIGGTDTELSDVDFIDANNGWVVGFGECLRTRNGGVTWSLQPFFGGFGVHFVNVSEGWAVGFGFTSDYTLYFVLHTVDGGATWYYEETDTTNLLVDVYFINANEGWAVGYNGTIFHTIDNGTTWQKQNSGTGSWLNGVHFVNAAEGWAVGDNGTILRRRNNSSVEKFLRSDGKLRCGSKYVFPAIE